MDIYFSIIIPVYNRPDEIQELLGSFLEQEFTKPYEIVIVEDGSTQSSEEVVGTFAAKLPVTYLKKENTGPGDSRNYGMRHAKGNYFIILDSDCILPPDYLKTVWLSLQQNYVDCFGGPDAAHKSFTAVQKAINYSMTSVLTTGGIRGNETSVNRFQPRSFNMGLSKKAFEVSGGFKNIHPGEDPDLTIRLWKQAFNTKLIAKAYVYHKRRIDWFKFFIQVKKFGMVRPILNKWHPETSRITYWFPTLFCLGFLISIALLFVEVIFPMFLYLCYFLVILVHSLVRNKKLSIAAMSVLAAIIQFTGYGYGFLKSVILVNFSKKKPEQLFPNLFFNNRHKR